MQRSLFIASRLARPALNASRAASKQLLSPSVRAAAVPLSRFMASTASSAVGTAAGEPAMFCMQCEQTDGGRGCSTIGVCGKTPETSALQDLLLHQLKGLSRYVVATRKITGQTDAEIDAFTLQTIFSCLTNVNFDSDRFVDFLKETERLSDKARKAYEAASGKSAKSLDDPQYQLPADKSVASLEARGHEVASLFKRRREQGEDPTLVDLQELIMYGLKGVCAYAEHAYMLGAKDAEVFGFVQETLAKLSEKPTDAGELLGHALKLGEVNLKVMSMLEGAHISTFGDPTPTQVRTTQVEGKCILISGHDLHDLEELLKQTEGKGINVYTHGEMLPAHGYPGLRKYKHLVGNYGTAWQLQKFDFASFPGAIVMTSNCLIEPKKSYKQRIFTRSVTGWPGVTHLPGTDFTPAIEAALKEPGFTKAAREERFTTVGFGRNTVLSVAPAVLEQIKQGNLKHLWFIGGCDGSEGERNYFKEVALSVPDDGIILTAGCGKYRFNMRPEVLNAVTKHGLPKMLDMGQCNDAYGAIMVAKAVADALGTEVNKLPLSFAVSWFEQKAVAVLLSLLHLNVQNIHLGPNLPAFCTPAMLEILQKNYRIKPISSNIHQEMQDYLKDGTQ